MRLWSLNPCLLDSSGLVAVWREALLARKVLQGKTRGYKNHPQLDRFKKAHDPIVAINSYLASIYKESVIRGYKFDSSKIPFSDPSFIDISVTSGQLIYEFEHLKKKCKERNLKQYQKLEMYNFMTPMDQYMVLGFLKLHNPIFRVVINESLESWERIKV